ncbi:MAG TPA: ArgE/DapE family deacylase [Nocardioidaceae bacterium]|nr:ArgE/DapE family deacylase [Nocardioidaceae bacterium]
MPGLTRTEERALRAVDGSDAVDLLVELLAVASISGTAGESDIQHLLAKKLEHLDLDVDQWPLDLADLSRRPGFPGVESVRDEAWGLVGTWPGEGAVPSLILQGHVDVVPPGDLHRWSAPPFEPVVTTHRVHARGACDMKAGVAANLAAVAAIKRAGVVLRDTFALHLVVGEEDGGLGAFGTLARGHTGRACIITEPTSGTLTTANAGALTFTIEVPGLATHASTSYAGRSAIDSYVALHRGLHELQERRNLAVEPLLGEYPVAYPISIGRLRAGDWASSVPDLLVAEGRMGIGIAEEPSAARTQLEEQVASIAARDPFLVDHPPRVSWSGGQFAGGSLPACHPLRETVARAHADATSCSRPRERGAPYGSDLRLYRAEDIPTLHYGPGDVRLAHGPDESVPIRELLAVTRALVLCILRSCGTLA